MEVVAPAVRTLDAPTPVPVTSQRRAPVIVIATANEAEGARHLRSLSSELTDIAAALAEGLQAGICEIVTLPNATPEQVVRTFQDDDYRDRIAVFHFAGHAGPEGLLLETATGSTAVADAGGLAAFLGCQRGLQLVVLNACATQSHVDALREAGVGAVIATSRSVEDAIAHEFAVQFYQGLGSGAGIKRAYDEAAAGVRFKRGAAARGVTVDSMHASAAAVSAPIATEEVTRGIVRKNAIETDDGRWPWDIYFRRGAEEAVAPWALPEAAGNPLFGLPPVPESEKPIDEPFRHLRPFAREHAETFFGRGKDIRELFDKVTGAASEPVTLLFGATGVGKSSLLDAGLLPRLTSLYEVRYAARDRALGLLGTLAHVLGGDAATAVDAAHVADAWRSLEQTCGRPLFVVIDQVEEAYTSEDSGRVALGAAARELDAFAAALASLFANDATRPHGRLVLGFRKEWLSEVKGALETHRVPRVEHRLEQLTRGGVLEAITGPTRVPQRRMPTRLEIEPGLDVLIADDLLANRASHVAPLLQILLAEMWAEAPRTDAVVRFDQPLYQTVRAKAKQIDEFVTQQIDALRAWHAPFVESGLVLEFLRFYTTPKATSDEHSASDEQKRYPKANDVAPGLRAMCARLFLLVVRDTDDSGAPLADPTARLAHDTLAPTIRERFDRSDLPGPRAKRVLDGRSAEWKDGHVGTPLDTPDLTLVEAGESGMRAWNDEERALVEASRVERQRARRRRAWIIRGAIAAVTLIAAFGVGSWLLYGQSQTRLADSTSREFAARAVSIDPERQDVALLYGVAAYERGATFEARRALFTPIAHDPQLIRVAPTGGSDMVFAPDGKTLLLSEVDDIYALDIASGIEKPIVTVKPEQMDVTTLTLDRDGVTYSGVVNRDPVSHHATIGIWDVTSGRQVGLLTVAAPDSDEKFTWQVGPPNGTGARVVAATDGNDTVLWDLASGRRGFRLRGHTDAPLRATFSADGSVLLTQAYDGRVMAWNVATGRLLRTARTALGRFASVAVSRDNSTMVVVADDTLALWPIRNSRPPRRLTGIEVQHVGFTPGDAELVVSARRGEIQLFGEPLDIEQTLHMPPSRTLYGAGDVPQAMAVSAAGSRIAQLSSEGTVHVWDLADSTVVRPFPIEIDSISQIVALGADGRFTVGMHDTVLTVWDITASRAVGQAAFRSNGKLLPAGFSIDIGAAGRFVAGPAREPAGRGPRDVFDVTTGRLVRSIGASAAATVAIDPANARVAYGIRGTRAAVLLDLTQPGRADTLDPGAMARYPRDSSYAPIVAFSPRGDLLIVQATQSSVLVWDLATRRLRDTFKGTSFYSSQLIASEDGSTVAAVAIDATSFWRSGQSAALSRYRGTTPREIALSPDGKLFAFGDNGVVTVADVARGEPLGQLETGQQGVSHMAFVDGGRTLMVVDELGNGVRLAITPDSWIARACSIASSTEAIGRWVDDAPATSRPPQRCSAPAAGRR